MAPDHAIQRRVMVLFNLRSGLAHSLSRLVAAIEEHWNAPEIDLFYQVSNSVADGQCKVRRALASGVDTILVAGGDGMINTIGAQLLGTEVAFGVLPTGSGNGFARHFDIPLQPVQAAAALRRAQPQWIDVGFANGRPFFVTCGMAADASLMRHFEKSPVRGIAPYAFAAAYELFEYTPQPFCVSLDGGPEERFDGVLAFTVANLTQYGGGARIAPQALADDGRLEMVVVPAGDPAKLAIMLPSLFNGTLDKAPGVVMRRFERMDVVRERPGVIQVDGELMESPARVEVRVHRHALRVLVPGERKPSP